MRIFVAKENFILMNGVVSPVGAKSNGVIGDSEARHLFGEKTERIGKFVEKVITFAMDNNPFKIGINVDFVVRSFGKEESSSIVSECKVFDVYPQWFGNKRVSSQESQPGRGSVFVNEGDFKGDNDGFHYENDLVLASNLLVWVKTQLVHSLHSVGYAHQRFHGNEGVIISDNSIGIFKQQFFDLEVGFLYKDQFIVNVWGSTIGSPDLAYNMFGVQLLSSEKRSGVGFLPDRESLSATVVTCNTNVVLLAEKGTLYEGTKVFIRDGLGRLISESANDVLRTFVPCLAEFNKETKGGSIMVRCLVLDDLAVRGFKCSLGIMKMMNQRSVCYFAKSRDEEHVFVLMLLSFRDAENYSAWLTTLIYTPTFISSKDVIIGEI